MTHRTCRPEKCRGGDKAIEAVQAVRRMLRKVCSRIEKGHVL